MASKNTPAASTGDDAAQRRFEVLDRTVCYDGYFRLERVRVRFRLFRGGWSPPVVREVFERGHVAAVLLYDPDRDRVVLVEQFRAPAIDAPGGPWVIEVVAGIIEPGETPEAVVRRESVEETGCGFTDVARIGEVILTPGGSSERLTLYCGRVDSSAADGVHGLGDEGEDIRVVVMPASEALDAVADGRIHAANAVIALQWLALNRDRLRKAWRDGG